MKADAISATHAKDKSGRLSNARKREVETLSDEFDRLLAGMQGRVAAARMNAAFHASPEEMGTAAIAAARKRD
jgi:hypothetical protein